MKWLLSLLVCFTALGQPNSLQDPAFLELLKPAAAAEFSGVFYETAEGTGYLTSGWVESGTTTPDEDSTTVVLQGSQSIRMTDGGTDAKTTNTFAGARLLSISWMNNFVSYATGTRDGLSLYNSGGIRIFYNRLDGDGSANRGIFTMNGTVVDGTLGDFPTNSATKIWVDFDFGSNPGVSTDGAIDIFWVTNAVASTAKPATTNLTATGFNAVSATGTLGLQLVGEEVVTDWDFLRFSTNGLILD